jgi:hypothetical protein
VPVPRHRRSGVEKCLGPAAKSGTITTITTERVARNRSAGIVTIVILTSGAETLKNALIGVEGA